MRVCPLDIAINALPRREKGAYFFCGIAITHTRSLGPCEIPSDISKVGTKESWMQKTLFPKYWQLASDHAICSLHSKYGCVHCFSMLATKNKQKNRSTFFSFEFKPYFQLSVHPGQGLLIWCWEIISYILEISWEFSITWAQSWGGHRAGKGPLLTAATHYMAYSQNLFQLFVAHQPLSFELFITEQGPWYHYATTTHNAQCLFRELFWKHRA